MSCQEIIRISLDAISSVEREMLTVKRRLLFEVMGILVNHPLEVSEFPGGHCL